MRATGITPIVVDVFDAAGLAVALKQVRPDLVIHQLTDLNGVLERERMEAAIQRNARLRTEGTRNLTEAASGAAAQRLIAQSIAWGYAQGPEPHAEHDPLDLNAAGLRGVSVRGVAALEESVLSARPEGIVLRYGQRTVAPPRRQIRADEPAGSPAGVDTDANGLPHASILSVIPCRGPGR
jgi:hypothetical protein